MAAAKTLAFYDTAAITVVKCFIIHAPVVSGIRNKKLIMI
jgi:hypothetical protein